MEKTLTGIGNVTRKYNIWFILFLTSVLMLIACDSGIKTTTEKVGVSGKNDKEIIFSMIIEHPDLQQYFHPEEESRTPLKVKSNKTLGTDLSIMKFGKPVEFYISTDFDSSFPLFEVVLFSIVDNKATFDILYAVEGVTARGELKKQNNQWSFVEFNIFES